MSKVCGMLLEREPCLGNNVSCSNQLKPEEDLCKFFLKKRFYIPEEERLGYLRFFAKALKVINKRIPLF